MLITVPKGRNAGSNNNGMTYPVPCRKCGKLIKVVKKVGKSYTGAVEVCRKCQRS